MRKPGFQPVIADRPPAYGLRLARVDRRGRPSAMTAKDGCLPSV